MSHLYFTGARQFDERVAIIAFVIKIERVISFTCLMKLQANRCAIKWMEGVERVAGRERGRERRGRERHETRARFLISVVSCDSMHQEQCTWKWREEEMNRNTWTIAFFSLTHAYLHNIIMRSSATLYSYEVCACTCHCLLRWLFMSICNCIDFRKWISIQLNQYTQLIEFLSFSSLTLSLSACWVKY